MKVSRVPSNNLKPTLIKRNFTFPLNFIQLCSVSGLKKKNKIIVYSANQLTTLSALIFKRQNDRNKVI